MFTLFKNFIYLSLICFLSISFLGCSGGENKDFSFLDESSNSGDATRPPQIVSFPPTDDPLRMVANDSETFAVTVGPSAGDSVTYTYKLNTALLSMTANPYYSLDGALLNAGTNTLEVTATNELGLDTKIFNITRNTPPSLDLTSPAAAGNNVACGGGSLVFNVTASDAETDGLTFTWKFNGSAGASDFSVTTTGNNSVNTFSPSCITSGSNTVSVDVSDSFQTTSYSWAVSISNPSVAQITAYLPLTNPVIIPSTGNQDFSISATGKTPLAYSWQLNGTDIPGETTALVN